MATPFGTIFVSDGSCFLATWPLTVDGNVAPTTKIVGATNSHIDPISTPCYDIKVDPVTGYIWTVVVLPVGFSVNTPAMLGYAGTATGDIAPVQIIHGPDVGFNGSGGFGGPNSMTLDANSNIYVLAHDGAGETMKVLKYPSGSNGNVIPTTLISDASINAPQYIFFDSARALLWITYRNTNSDGVAAIAGYDLTGTLVYKISGANTQLSGGGLWRMWVDKNGSIYAAVNDRIVIFSSAHDGNIVPDTVISGSNTTFNNGAVGVAVDSDLNIYVANASGADTNGSVTIFNAGASGNAVPDRILAGSATGFTFDNLDLPSAIFITESAAPPAPFSCLDFEIQTPSREANPRQTALVNRWFIDCDLAGQTLTPVVLVDNQEITLSPITNSQRGTIEVASQQYGRLFALRLTGCLTQRIEIFHIHADMAQGRSFPPSTPGR